jgi:PAS domain S-box-containing protein
MIDYQKVFESAPVLFVILGADESFPILDASNAYLRATYTERDAIVGQSLFRVFPNNPEEQGAIGTANLRSSLKRVLADGRPDTMAVQKYNIRRPASEGGGLEERYWSPVNAPVFGPDGRMLFIVHRVEDVTELSRANRALERQGETMRLEATLRDQELQEANRRLREATAQFQAIFEQGLFAARLRLDGTVIDINRAAVEVCGLNRADILDRPFWECGWWNRSPDVQAWVRNAVMQAVAGEPFRGESRYFWGDGSEHIVDFACMPIRDAAGRVVVVVPTGMDITERVQAEKNQQALEAERRRSEALTAIDRAKTAFFSNVSHEFRTPLTLMLGPLEDALRHADELPPKRLEEVTVAHRNALRLLRLVNTLLDFSRVEAGRVQVNLQEADLAVLTRDLASNFYSVSERAGLALNIACDPLPRTAYVDIDMWEKIVLNLLSNAFKFTFEGSIDVRLRDADGSVELTISDTGVGIPTDELPHVFVRFHRVEGQHGRTHEGSGIGLALVRELVNLHGGEVRVSSAVGRGTSFVVVLPYRESRSGIAGGREISTATRASAFVEEALRWLPQTADASPLPTEIMRVPADDAPLPGALRGPRAKVLVADDNADMRDYVRRLLTPHYDVETVGNGLEALRAIRRERPDLLLSDVMMPERDGFALLREIRADPQLSGLPVVLLSARAGDEAKVEGLNAGADDYLIKPFSAQELVARVNTNIMMARLRREITRELEMQKTQLQAVLDTVPVAVWFTFDSAGQQVVGNRYAAEMLRLPETANASLSVPATQAPQHFRLFRDGVEVSPDQLPLRRAVLGEIITNEEMELRFADGSRRAGLVQAAPVRDASGQIVGAVSAGLDITERKRIEEHRQLLLNELNHRVKNTLATVQSVAAQSFRLATTDASGREMFEARLLALSRAHDVLTDESWEGANLNEIVAQAILPYRGGDPGRFGIEGPAVWLSAKMALSISMALHELATNAAKYGALSSHQGRVDISWIARQHGSECQLRLEWLESGGPAVVPPKRKGFGSRLIERGLAQELGGEARLEYRPAGLWCEITAQLDP